MIKYKRHLKVTSRKLRVESTEEEIILWSRIRKKQILNIQFYRQRPLLGYIADFYAPKINLVVEIDGAQHYEESIKAYDEVRTKYLESQGVEVKRYTNTQIRYELKQVLDDIYKHIMDQMKE